MLVMNQQQQPSQPSNQTRQVPPQPHQSLISLSYMGEQTQPQTQIQAPQSHAQSQPHPPLPHDTTTPQVVPAAPPSTTAAHPSATIAPHNSASSIKIPFRPRKIRKVSSDGPSDNSDNKSLQIVEGDCKTTTTTNGDHKPNINNSGATTTASNKKNKIVVQQVRVLPRVVARTLSCEGEIALALQYLRNSDPQLARLIDIHQPPTFDSFHPPFLALTKSILYQQLAYKAGTSIYTRFVSLCGGEAGVVPEAVLALSPQQLRQIGVSGRKASYLHDLANKYRNGILSDASIVDMDDKSLFTMLTMVKGIGSWSVHMFMIFSLHRPDVLPVGDIGVRKGVQLLYGLDQLPRPSQMEQLCEKWRPYRSVASWYMWRFAEAKGAPASAAAVAVGVSQQQQLQQHQLQQPQQQHQQHQQHQQPPQPQLIDPMHGMANLGACAWGQ
ncbi:PREDICTED: uncharacterized protein LOC104595671 isoform X2 [Nelumbo nucifera]|uniref:Uncharacterized protein LOC104595671 isoform X2 n=1 Tax=Nelumbo nucifera TaxID=4432 RepID=A0A1U7ZLA3_NELNU|nr:PREDICTED: uncharacterized protein LOC104595671 isoform X2 [Nelumbo nucifera]